MSVKTLVLATVAAGCVGVAATGGYLAGQMNPAEESSAPLVEAEPRPVSLEAEPRADQIAGDDDEQAGTPAVAPEPAPVPRREPRRPRSTDVTPAFEPPAAPSRVATPEPAAAPLPPPVSPQSLPTAEPPLPILPPPPGPPIATEPEPMRIGLIVEADSVIGVRLETPVSTATAKVEDRVVALVSREVLVDGQVAIPAGSRIEGYVTLVERGGKFRERARIGLTFSTLVLSPQERLPIHTETIHRDGESPAADATSKIGASAVVGSILGAVIGGKKGAAIGGAAGAAGGTAAVAAGGKNEAALAEGTPLTLRLVEAITIVVER